MVWLTLGHMVWMKRGFILDFRRLSKLGHYIHSFLLKMSLNVTFRLSMMQSVLLPLKQAIRLQHPFDSVAISQHLICVFHSSLRQAKVLSWDTDVTWIPLSLTSPPSWPHCRPPSRWVMRRGTTASTTSPWPVLRSISALFWLFSSSKRQIPLLTM